MTYSKLLAILTVILAFFTFSLNIPCAAQASSQKTVKSASKKSGSAKAKKTAEQKTASKKGKSKKSRSHSAKKSRKAAVFASERDLWLDRSRNSDIIKGMASWYSNSLHNKSTASGLNYDMYTFTAAHRTLPLGTVVKVTDQNNGKSVMVCVTDRGPFVRGRIIDLSFAAAKKLGLHNRGVGKVELEVVSDENGSPLNSDKAYFVRYGARNGKNSVGPFNAFADAAAMHEALSLAHPEAEVILENSEKKAMW